VGFGCLALREADDGDGSSGDLLPPKELPAACLMEGEQMIAPPSMDGSGFSGWDWSADISLNGVQVRIFHNHFANSCMSAQNESQTPMVSSV
jgi:hypothetical protein